MNDDVWAVADHLAQHLNVPRDAIGLIRQGENTIYRLPGGLVARVARPGQNEAAVREVAVARWLESNGITAAQTYPGLPQPVEVLGRPVTFWRELPAHRHGDVRDVAAVLRQLHDLPPPEDLALPALAPFVRLKSRIRTARCLDEDDRSWLLRHLETLVDRYAGLPIGLPPCVIHGDAWVGNILATSTGPILIDLERCSVGPPEWDLVSTAIKHTSFGLTSAPDYQAFVNTYGYDVTTWAGFETLRDIRELRMATYMAQAANDDPRLEHQANLRVASLRGGYGERPWTNWRAAP